MPFEASAQKGSNMHYVYPIESVAAVAHRYVGVTADLKRRLEDPNTGKSPHSSKYKPWSLVTYIAISNQAKAETLERFPKSGSGHAFAKKRLW